MPGPIEVAKEVDVQVEGTNVLIRFPKWLALLGVFSLVGTLVGGIGTNALNVRQLFELRIADEREESAWRALHEQQTTAAQAALAGSLTRLERSFNRFEQRAARVNEILTRKFPQTAEEVDEAYREEQRQWERDSQGG